MVEWFDPHAQLARKYNLMLWEADQTTEIYDTKARRTFLKRTTPPEPIRLEDFFIGGVVTIYSRRFTILEFADPLTSRRFEVARSTTLALVKPDGYPHIGKIMDIIYQNGLEIGRMKMLKLSKPQAAELVSTRPAGERATLAGHLSRDVVVALELVGDDCVSRWHGIMGPSNPADARDAAPRSIRAQFGTDAVCNTVYGSASTEDAKRELGLLLGSDMKPTAVFNSCAFFLIKPHLVAAKKAGEVIDELLEAGVEVSGMATLSLDRTDAEDFLEVYKDVVPEYARWVVEISSGSAIALELRGEDIISRVRAMCGPYDPEIARHIRPDSLRARFGVNSVRNGFHCTDLPLDGPLESKFMFTVV